eukprot:g19957.t1
MHPLTTLVDGVISSFDLAPGLQRCPLIIVADGVRLIPSDSRRRLEKPNKNAHRQMGVSKEEMQERLRLTGSLTGTLENLGCRRASSCTRTTIKSPALQAGDDHVLGVAEGAEGSGAVAAEKSFLQESTSKQQERSEQDQEDTRSGSSVGMCSNCTAEEQAEGGSRHLRAADEAAEEEEVDSAHNDKDKSTPEVETARLRLNKTNQTRQRVVWKRGRITAEDYANYVEYCERLREKYGDLTTSAETGPRSSGTASGGTPDRTKKIYYIVQVTTEYVLVVQHDRAFVEKVNFPRAMELMESEENIRYIGFQSRTNLNYPNNMASSCYLPAGPAIKKCRGRYGEWAKSEYFCETLWKPKRGLRAAGGKDKEDAHAASEKTVAEAAQGQHMSVPMHKNSRNQRLNTSCLAVRPTPRSAATASSNPSQELQQPRLETCLIPLFFWYDSTHICRAQPYRRLIERECKVGQFIESTYGIRMEEQIKRDGAEGRWSFAHHLKQYGCFLFHDEKVGVDRPIVAHLHGRMFWSKEERVARGWPARDEQYSSDEDDSVIAHSETVCVDGLDSEERRRRRRAATLEPEEENELYQRLFDGEI